MRLTDEMVELDDRKYRDRNVLDELKYGGREIRHRKTITNDDLRFMAWLCRSALNLLKEQEPVKPTVSVDTWICSKCGHTFESQELIDDKENPQVLIHEQYEYCPNCGRKVKWE